MQIADIPQKFNKLSRRLGKIWLQLTSLIFITLILPPSPLLATVSPQFIFEAPESLAPLAAHLEETNPTSFQRIMDLAWAAGDSQARGFLLGATAGRTTLNGEGLQHQDGHSHLMANMIPNCRSYDPAYAYELTVILQDGMKRMYEDKENCFYYVTLMNENYTHPDMPIGCEEGIIKGIYQLAEAQSKAKLKVQLLGGGTILREVEAAAEILLNEYKVDADIWSLTSVNELRRNGLTCEHWNLLNPAEPQKVPYVAEVMDGHEGPVICATDYMKSYGEQIRPYIKARYTVLGTDGYGRSDTRAQLRHHFEVDRKFVVIAALKALADDGEIKHDVVTKAMKKFGISADKRDPMIY